MVTDVGEFSARVPSSGEVMTSRLTKWGRPRGQNSSAKEGDVTSDVHAEMEWDPGTAGTMRSQIPRVPGMALWRILNYVPPA